MERYKAEFPGVSVESELTREKNNEHRKRIARSEAGLLARSKVGRNNKGKKRTKEWKKARSLKYTGEGNPFYGKSHSFEVRKKLSIIHQKTNPELWDGFTYDKWERLRNSVHYIRWRKEVFRLDNFTCQLCFVRGGDLQAHHIYPRSKFPEKMLDIDNGVSLCVKCHSKTFNKEMEFVSVFKEAIQARGRAS